MKKRFSILFGLFLFTSVFAMQDSKYLRYPYMPDVKKVELIARGKPKDLKPALDGMKKWLDDLDRQLCLLEKELNASSIGRKTIVGIVEGLKSHDIGQRIAEGIIKTLKAQEMEEYAKVPVNLMTNQRMKLKNSEIFLNRLNDDDFRQELQRIFALSLTLHDEKKAIPEKLSLVERIGQIPANVCQALRFLCSKLGQYPKAVMAVCIVTLGYWLWPVDVDAQMLEYINCINQEIAANVTLGC